MTQIPESLVRAKTAMQRQLDRWRASCPTGSGGGVDPTCSPGQQGGSIGDAAQSKVYCPNGPGGGVDPSCVSGGLGSLAGIGDKMAKWPQHNPAVKWANKKIGMLEKLASDGKWDEFEKAAFVSKAKSPNTYQKSVLEAQKNLAKLKGDQVKAMPAGSSPGSIPASLDTSTWKKVGGKLGTEKGGVYEDATGKKYYVKTPDDPARVHNEVLASKLYQVAGAGVVKAHLVDMDGKPAMATEWLESKKVDWDAPQQKVVAGEDFAVHAWLNNRDAVGAGSENPMDNIRMDSKTGKLVAVDVGGALDYKGMGGSGKKPFGPNADEWETLRDPGLNSSMGKVFGDMTGAQLYNSAQKLKGVTDKHIDDLVDTWGNKSNAHEIKTTLKARRDSILAKADHFKPKAEAAAAAQAAPKPAAPKPAAPEAAAPKPAAPKPAAPEAGAAAQAAPKPAAPPKAAPTANAPAAVPPPPTITSKYPIQGYQKKLDAIHAAAASGDISKVQAIKTNPESKQTYAKKTHDYKEQVLAAMGAGGKVVASHVTKPKSVKSKPQKVTIDQNKFPPEPSFSSGQLANVAKNQAAIGEMKKLAAAGDLDGLKAHPGTPSPKVVAYKNELASNLAHQLNPPPPPKAIDAHYAELVSKIPAKPSPGMEKVGNYSILQDLGGVPQNTPTGYFYANPQVNSLMTAGKAQWETLPNKASIKSYTGGGYTTCNSDLRKGKTTPAARGIMKVTDDLPVGGKVKRFHNLHDKEKIRPGHVISERGLLSTSTRSDWTWSGNTEWQMTIGHGVKGLPAKLFSNHPGESEIIMPPNSRMMVTKVDHNTKLSNGETGSLFEVVLLPTESGQCCPP